MLDIKDFSKRYTIRTIMPSDVAQVFSLCKGNELYYKYCTPFVTEQSIINDLEALPEGKDIADKYYVGFFDGKRLVAVMDLIDKYPNEATVFIGFFMLDVSVQHQGVGTSIIQELLQYLRSHLYRYVRLGWVKGNLQSESFWHKIGFVETGIFCENDEYTVIVAQLDL